MRWEELKTPDAVMAAFEAGRRVEFMRVEMSGWLVAEYKSAVRINMAGRTRYRALIEDAPPIPEGYTPWAGGECPEDARDRRTWAILRDGTHCDRIRGDLFVWADDGTGSTIVGYRVEQPERQGEAVLGWVKQGEIDAVRRNRDGGAVGVFVNADRSDVYSTPIYVQAQPIPVESLGRPGDGVEALAADVREALDRHSCPDHYMRLAYEAVVANAARRLRPTVDASTAERRARELLAAEYDRDGIPFVADCIRTDAMLSGPETRAIRALTAALTTSPEADNG